MIYTSLTKKAIRLMFCMHKDQTDKCGIPYVFHPWHVAESMTDEYSTCAALLHDVPEDTDMTAEDLLEEGFPEEVVEAVRYLTHEPGTDYFDYVRKVGQNPIARKVKLADLRHNSDLSRMDRVTDRDRLRQKKYLACIEYLESLSGS